MILGIDRTGEYLQKRRMRTFDTFDGAKPRFSNRGKKRRSVSTLSIPRALARGVEWVDFVVMGHHKLVVYIARRLRPRE